MQEKDRITPYLFLEEEEAGHRRRALPQEGEIQKMTDFFKMFSDPHRARILSFLRQGELCVGDLAALLDATPSAVSHQLKLLRSVALVRYRRKGKILFYALADRHVEELLDQGLEHIRE